jgi:hypothetical protein
MTKSKRLSPIECPQTAKDDYTLGLWRKYGLGDHPSYASMEATVIRLLRDPGTQVEAASMVARHKVHVEREELGPILALEPEAAFDFLLLNYNHPTWIKRMLRWARTTRPG